MADTLFACTGQKLIIDVGNPGCNYQWNTGASSQNISTYENGDFWVKVTNQSNCSIKKEISARFIEPTTFTLGDDLIETCADELIELNPGIENENYLWSTNETTQSIIPHQSGLYSLILTNQGGCQSTGQIFVIINDNEIRFIDKTIQEGETYTFFTQEIMNGGIYTHIDSSYNCPQKVILNLSVRNQNEKYGGLCGNIQYDRTDQLAGINLLLRSTDNGKEMLTQSQLNGQFCFETVPAGEYYLCAMAGHLDLPGSPADCYFNGATTWTEATEITINENETQNLTFILTANENNMPELTSLNNLHSINGNIVYLQSEGNAGIYRGQPGQIAAEGSQQTIRFVLSRVENTNTTFFKTTLSDEKGEYNFQYIPDGYYLLEVDIPGLAQYDNSIIVFEGGSSSKEINFKIIKDFAVSSSLNLISNDIKIYPNPCSDVLKIEVKNSEYNLEKVQLFDLTGKLLFEKNIQANSYLLATKQYVNGVYILKIGNDIQRMFKLIVN